MMGSVIKNKYKYYFLHRLGRKGRLYTGYLLIVQLNVHDFVVEERNNKHSVNWRPPLIFRRNWDCPLLSQGLDEPPPSPPPPPPPPPPHPLSEGMDPPLPTSNFIWGAPPREFELTCSLSLDKFPRRNSYTQLTVYCSWANWATMCYTCAWVLVKNCLYQVPDCTGSDQGRTLWLPGVCWNAPFAGDHPNDNGQIEELNKT